MDRRLALSPLGKPTVVFLLLFGAALPIGLAALMVLAVQQGRIEPALMLVTQAAFAFALLAVVLPLWRRDASFDGQRLRVRAMYFTRETALSGFDLDAARVVDVREHTELRPVMKTFGYQVPGLRAGHFRLRDGRKAFCLLSDLAKVLALPHADGRVWLLSLEHPQAVLDILRRAKA